MKEIKDENKIMGILDYDGREIPFVYEEGRLLLIPPSREEWIKCKKRFFEKMSSKSEKKHRWIETILLKGESHDGNQIVFKVKNLESNNNGYISYQVVYIMKYSSSEFVDETKIKGFRLSGREINYFYSPLKSLDVKFSNAEKNTFFDNFQAKKIEEEVGIYTYKRKKAIITVGTFIKYSFNSTTPLSVSSYIDVFFSKPIDLDTALEIIHHFRKLLYYVCRRRNIQLDDVGIYGNRNGQNRIEGTFHECLDNSFEETNKNQNKRIIKYEYLKGKCISLLSAIADESMYFEHLTLSIDSTNSYNISRVILNFVAFEREFRNLYGKEYVRSKEYEETKEEALECLKNLKVGKSRKRKKYLDGFVKTLQKTENSFENKMEFAMKDCQRIIKPFMILKYHRSDSKLRKRICERMNLLRNDSAHGNIDLEVKAIHMSDFYVLEVLLYAMRLKKIGMSIEDSQKVISELMGANLFFNKS